MSNLNEAAAVTATGQQNPENQPEGDQTMEEVEPPPNCVLRDEFAFIQNVSQFYNQEALSDIIIKIGELTFYGHKFVLAKSSDVFRAMLYEKTWSTDVKDEIELNESSECQAVFDKFLRYLYTAEVVISTQSAVGILCLADKYGVSSLKDLCTEYMIKNSRSPNVNNAITWYSWAKALHLEDLIVKCTQTISWNYHEIIMSNAWFNMDLEFLCDMLSSCELVVANENSLWEAVQKWVTHEVHIGSLEENIQRLLPLVRFPQMMVSQLYLLEQSELATNPVCKDLLHELLSKAYRFRALCPSQNILGVSFSDPFYLPRDYMELTVDTVRMQNTLRFGIQVDVKMFRGPVPSEIRDGDWKITYRKQNDIWSLLLYCHETAMVHNEARIQPTVLVYDEGDRVLQVHREDSVMCTRGSTVTIQATIDHPAQARNLAVLIKPVPT